MFFPGRTFHTEITEITEITESTEIRIDKCMQLLPSGSVFSVISV
jgi:hypothetical protein